MQNFNNLSPKIFFLRNLKIIQFSHHPKHFEYKANPFQLMMHNEAVV